MKIIFSICTYMLYPPIFDPNIMDNYYSFDFKNTLVLA